MSPSAFTWCYEGLEVPRTVLEVVGVHFERMAGDYDGSRPPYPRGLYDHLTSAVPSEPRGRCWRSAPALAWQHGAWSMAVAR